MTFPDEPRRKIEIKNGRGTLFAYDPLTETIEIKHGDNFYVVDLYYLREFARTSQRNVYSVYESDLPCGHDAGIRKKDNLWVCSICDMPIS